MRDKLWLPVRADLRRKCYTDTDIEQIKVHELAVIKKRIRSHMDDVENDGWIPVDDTEHTPKDESYVLVSFSNYNLPDIARYEENEKGGTYYPGDDEQSYLKYGIFVNAWKPLPKPYKGE